MSTWKNPEQWQRWIRGEDCPICANISSAEAAAELEVTRLMMSEDAPMRGYAWLPLRRHAIELHDLDEDEGAAFMRDVRRVSRAIALATGAVKMNYEIHGNTVPHLHVHFFPRYVGDAFEGRPIAPKEITTPVYGPGEFEQIRTRVVSALSRDQGNQ